MNGASPLFSWGNPRFWLVPALALFGCAAVVATGSNERVFLLLNRLGPETSDLLWANLTILGDGTVALALCLLLARRRPDLLWAVVPSAILVSLWTRLWKHLVDVVRPAAVLGADTIHFIGPAYQYHSFPSGHATTAFSLAALCVLGFRLRALSLLPIAVAVTVAISRCVVGVHWPLDLLGGAFGGWLAAALGLKVAAALPTGLRPSAQWIIALILSGCALVLLLTSPTDYAQALWFQRAIGALSLTGFAVALAFHRSRQGAQG